MKWKPLLLFKLRISLCFHTNFFIFLEFFPPNVPFDIGNLWCKTKTNNLLINFFHSYIMEICIVVYRIRYSNVYVLSPVLYGSVRTYAYGLQYTHTHVWAARLTAHTTEDRSCKKTRLMFTSMEEIEVRVYGARSRVLYTRYFNNHRYINVSEAAGRPRERCFTVCFGREANGLYLYLWYDEVHKTIPRYQRS